MWPFKKKKPAATPAPAEPKPESHKRVIVWADKFNNSVTTYEELRSRVVAEIDDKREELRQIDMVLAALRAGLVQFVSDETLPFMTAQSARSHIEAGDLATPASIIDTDLTLDDYDFPSGTKYPTLRTLDNAQTTPIMPTQPHKYEARS